MIIQAFFGTAQTGVGYQFYDSAGDLIGSRSTVIDFLPGAGAYYADVTPPVGAVGVYWDSDTSEAHEDLREALSIDALNDYDGSDTAGTATLLSRLTLARAGYLDNLNGLDVNQSVTDVFTAYDPPTRAEATADKNEILSRGDIAWTGGSTPPTAAEIADAVLDEDLADHTTAGTTGSALAAAIAAGDPWATVVPAAYDDGTAGAAIGRLNNTPADAPIVVLPDPSEDTSLCNVYFDNEDGEAVSEEGWQIKFTPIGDFPQKTSTDKLLYGRDIIAKSGPDGRIIVALGRGLSFKMTSEKLFGENGATLIVPDAASYNYNSSVT